MKLSTEVEELETNLKHIVSSNDKEENNSDDAAANKDLSSSGTTKVDDERISTPVFTRHMKRILKEKMKVRAKRRNM